MHLYLTPAQASSALLTLQEGGSSPNKKMSTKRNMAASSASSLHLKTQLDEMTPVITFKDWLCSVTEKINQTMHYQFDG